MSAGLELHLDAGPWPGEQYARAWPVGGRISGNIRVVSTDETRARGVRVDLSWKTEGRGNVDNSRVVKEVLHEGHITAGSDFKLPFELLVPADGPITYDGHYINIRWEVAAVVDIPWGRDTVERQTVMILPTYETA